MFERGKHMITHNRIKTNIFASLFGLLLGVIYLYFYINGYFGEALFGWLFLSDLLLTFVEPFSLIGLGLVLVIVLNRRKKPFHLATQIIESTHRMHLIVIVISTLIIVSLLFIDKQIALVYAFIYFFIVGFFSSYLIGMRMFKVKQA